MHIKALLIIDMQKGSFTAKTPRFDKDGVVKRVNALIQIFRDADKPIIFIQHDGSKENEFLQYGIRYVIDQQPG